MQQNLFLTLIHLILFSFKIAALVADEIKAYADGTEVQVILLK